MSETIKRAENFAKIASKIVGIGPNYKSTCAEIKWPVPDEDNWPNIFLKPNSAIVTDGQAIKIPSGADSVLYEVELGVVVGKTASGVNRKQAAQFIGGYTIVLDLTVQDWLLSARAEGRPWLFAKGFDTSCPVSPWISPALLNPNDVNLWCKVNGVLKQDANTSDMIFDVETIIEMITQTVTLNVGDVILTGCPPGQGPLKRGDTVEFGARGFGTNKFDVR